MSALLPLPMPCPPEALASLRVVGCLPIVLIGEYDPDQHWLPFVQALVVTDRAVEAERAKQARRKPKRLPAGEIGRALSERWAMERRSPPPPESTRLYHYEAGVAQMQLPFVEQRSIGKKALKRLEGLGYPGFERIRGKVCTVRWGVGAYDAVSRWCKDNALGRYRLDPTAGVFERARDAVGATLAIPV